MKPDRDLSRIDPATIGLLVIDMQNAFCHERGTLGSDGASMGAIQRILEPLRTVVGACQDAGIQDLWSIQEHYENDATRQRHRLRPHTLKRFRVPALKDTWDGQIVDQLQPLINERSEVFRKNRFGCFYSTRLANLLRVYGIDTLVVTGVDTNVCVETTVREAYMRDLDVIVLSDCVGGVHENWHRVALQVWERYIGAVITSQTLLSLIHGWSTRSGEGHADRRRQVFERGSPTDG
jgi:ureidoacrylate peracid hydrolase